MPDYDVDREARTEEPTPRRIEEARERGQVARSQELVSVVVSLFVLVAVWLLAPYFFSIFGEAAAWTVERFSNPIPDTPAAAALILASLAWRTLLMLAPVAAVAVAAAVLSNVFQFGFVASAQPIAPDINRINPVQGLQRFLSLRTAEMLALAVAKVAFASAAVYLFLKLRGPRLAALVDGTVAGGLVAVLLEMLYLSLALLLVFLFLALLDLLFQRYQYRVDLRMTREELKEELRRLEGDPAIRARRRAAMRRLLFSRMLARVPESDVVVTNPTEFAVALCYRADQDRAPTVLAKGRKRMAERIRHIAVSAGVPIIERPVLARGLYFAVEVGGEVPQEFYQMVAEVLAYVYKMKRIAPQPETVGA